ncbi:THO complex subunit 1-like [Apostichopus japonicus]|uniref:THO complex subunit 1-like n=1 Tax=Stichopus japonicus TaxID=307972 RepID=UPI003AB1F8CF
MVFDYTDRNEELELLLEPSEWKEEPEWKEEEEKWWKLELWEEWKNHNNADQSDPTQNCNIAVETETLEDLSRELGGSWKSLGRYLGIADATLDSFQYDHITTQEAAYQMLLHWARLNGRTATIENLAKGLRRAGRTDLAQCVEG